MTRGEYRVGITFNPSGNEHVNEIKRCVADLIDYLYEWDEKINKHNPEASRLVGLSQQQLEEAAMNGVKAVTKGAFNA